MIVRHPSSSLSRALALVLAAGALAGTASAQTERRWRNPANGDWGSVANWVSNLPPSASETAYFGLNASATTYTVTSAINRTTAGFNVNNQRPTFLFGSAGSPATYTVNSFVTIGGTNSPAATLARGNIIAPANVMVGRNAGQPGTLTISGPESFWSGIDTIGQAAAGEVNVINGGTLTSSRPLFLGFATGASGLLRVDGANGSSRAQILGNGFVVLGTDGTGRIELLNGGQMSVNNEQFYVGDRGTASLLISGAGSSLTLPFQLRLAENAPSVATATVQAGGSITAQGVEIGQRGQATLIVKDPGSQVITNFSGIGLNGNGTLEIRDGALFRVTSGELNIGRSNNATGSVLISGPGSELDFQGWVRVGDNGGANGVLTIENGATPTLGNPLMIGHQPGSNGSLVVRGADTSLTVPGQLSVGGNERSGTLLLSDRASITVMQRFGTDNAINTIESAASMYVDGDVHIGDNATLRVTGLGSGFWQNITRGMTMSRRSRVEITSGGVASGQWLSPISNSSIDPSDVAVIEVRGEGSRLLFNDTLLGRNSRLVVADGASAEYSWKLELRDAPSDVLIQGQDSLIYAMETCIIGRNDLLSGSTLELDGGSLFTLGNVEVRRSGMITGSGWVLGNVVLSGRISPGHSGAGTLNIDAFVSDSNARTILDIAGPTPGSQHDLLAVAGNASLNGTIEISAAPGFDPPVGSTYDVMTYSSRSGPGFASVVSGALPAGKAFLVNTLPDRVRVEVGGVQSITPSAATVSTYTGFTPVVRLSASVLGSGGTSTIDATSTAQYIVDDPQVLQVTSPGNLRALAAGSTNLRIRFAGLETVVPVTVNAVSLPPTLSPGLDGTWYDLSFPKFSNLTPYRTIFPSKVGFDGADRFEAVGIVFTGLVNVPAAGDYRFVLGSDDGSRLFVNGQRVINNDGIHGGRDYEAVLSLPAGPADIRVEYYERGGGEGVRLRWERLGGFSLRDIEAADWAGNAVSAAYYALAFPNLNTLTLTWDDFVPSEQTVYAAFSDGDPNTRPSFGFPRSENGTTVGLRTSGFFFAPESGPITFTMQADDAAQMRINGSIILQSPLRNFNQVVTQTINLPAGFHAIEVDAHNADGFWGLLISANGSGFVNQILDQASLFRGELPPPCPADFDSDGFVDFFDFDFYVACFEDANACPPGKSADFDADGFVDFFDFDAFVAAFELGC